VNVSFIMNAPAVHETSWQRDLSGQMNVRTNVADGQPENKMPSPTMSVEKV